MTFTARVVRVAFLICALAGASPAFGQTSVRVTRDQTAVWTADFQSKVVVNAGTTLEVVGERKDWYEVVMPGDFRGKSGFVYKGSVEVATAAASPSQPAGVQNASASSPVDRGRTIGVLGFGEFGYARFAAQQSFHAVTGQGGDGFFGGGGEVRIGRGFFANVAINRFTQGGQRVYVADGEVFKLGVPVSVKLTPATATAGWRFAHERATPYVGAGVGRIRYQETFNFSDAGDGVDATFASYHVLGGVEFRNGWVATAFEVQYSRVPDSIGVGGASAAFQETDLGGVTARIRILVGR
jgi:outer membrane protein W